MMQLSEQLSLLLIELTNELRNVGLWQNEPISAELLLSEQPFCCDTLTFEQWLQFVFIVKLSDMIAHNQPLPIYSAVAPMAEEEYKLERNIMVNVIAVIVAIDELLSSQGSNNAKVVH